MPKQEVPMAELANYLPEHTFDAVLEYLRFYKVHLTIAKSRSSILGDYRHQHHNKQHRVSVNGNLNKYAFLITLLHELAHLITFDKFGNRVQSHGKEWKTIYGQILHQFAEKKVFPADVENALRVSIQNPGASTCADEGLQRILYRYDVKRDGHCLVEELTPGAVFKLKDGRLFHKGKRRTKRYECMEIKTGRTYLFSPVYEVQLVQEAGQTH